MRIGSLVSRERPNLEDHLEGQWFRPEGEPVGTVIAIEHKDRDGYEAIERLTVRWENGAVETVGLYSEDEDPQGDWALVDVTPETYANLYLYDQAYGGPEEGGWWYDTFLPVYSDWKLPPPFGHFPTPEAALAAAELLNEWCDKVNQSRPAITSTQSRGRFIVVVEAWPAEPSPKHRPHYC